MTPKELASKRRLDATMRKYGLGKCKQMALADFQKLVRLKAAAPDGSCQCVTCGRRKHWKQMHGGHFLPGRRNSVCFDPRNVHPQCVQCNTHFSGQPARYLEFMHSRYGADAVEDLRRRDREAVQLTRDVYADLCMAYRAEIRAELKRLGEVG